MVLPRVLQDFLAVAELYFGFLLVHILAVFAGAELAAIQTIFEANTIQLQALRLSADAAHFRSSYLSLGSFLVLDSHEHLSTRPLPETLDFVQQKLFLVRSLVQA